MILEWPTGVRNELDGVIGWPPLRTNVWFFDGPRENVDIVPEVPQEALRWQKLAVRQDNQLLLEVPTDRGVRTVLIDTGAYTGLALAQDAWEAWNAANPKRPATMQAHVILSYGLVVSPEAWADEVTLGPLTLRDVPVAPAPQAAHDAHPGYLGTIGLYGLSRMRLVVDGERNAAYVAPSDSPPKPYEHNRLGAVFTPKDLDSDPLIARVAPGSPAEEAGVRDGDRLLAIGGLDATRWRTDPAVMPLSRHFERAAGTPIHLTLERDGERKLIEAVLRDILAPKREPVPAR